MSSIGLILFYVVLIAGMWFLLMRPQKKEQKRVQAMLADMAIGDTALTTSGFYGVIIDITDDDVIVNLVIIRTAESRCRNQRSLRSKSREQNKQTGLSQVRKEQRHVKM